MNRKIESIKRILKNELIKDAYFILDRRIKFEIENSLPLKFDLTDFEVSKFKELGIGFKNESDLIFFKEWLNT